VQLAVIDQALGDAGVVGFQVADDGLQRVAGGGDALLPTGVGAQDRRDRDGDAHRIGSAFWSSTGLVLFNDFDGFFGDHAVDDAVAAQLVLVGIAGGHQHVVRVGFRRVGDVGAARVGLGRGVRVIDDHGNLVGFVHRAPYLELLAGVEPVER